MTAALPCDSCHVKTTGKPDAGNPHVRFDEGGRGRSRPLLYGDKERIAKFRDRKQSMNILFISGKLGRIPRSI